MGPIKIIATVFHLLLLAYSTFSLNILVTPNKVLVPAPKPGQQFTVAFTVSIGIPETTQISFITEGLNAIENVDFIPVSGTIAFVKETNITEEIVTLTLLYNPSLTNGNQVSFRFNVNENAPGVFNTQAVIIIQDTSSGGPYIFLDPVSTFVEKHKLYQQISVTVVPPSNTTVSISYNTVPSGNSSEFAVAGEDFIPTNGTLVFSPQGPSSQSIMIDIIAGPSTSDRSLAVVFNTIGATIPAGNEVLLTIGDNSEPYGSVYLLPSYQTFMDGTAQTALISAVLNPVPSIQAQTVQCLIHYYFDEESSTAKIGEEFNWSGNGFLTLNQFQQVGNLPLINLHNITVQKDTVIVIKIDLILGSAIVRQSQSVIIIRKSDLSITVTGDPHFTGFFGGNYDVKGENNSVFNILSDKNIQVNAKFFAYHTIFQSTFITEAAVKVGFVDRIYISTFKGKSSALINGVKAIPNSRVQLFGGSEVIITDSSVRIFVDAYAITIEALQSHILLPDETKLDVSFLEFKFALLDEDVMKADNVSPHGLVGQTANKREAVVPLYNSDQGEGVIEGNWTDYIVKSGLWEDDFIFNKFNPDIPQDIAFFEQMLNSVSQELRSSLINNNKNIPFFYLYQKNPEIFMGFNSIDQN